MLSVLRHWFVCTVPAFFQTRWQRSPWLLLPLWPVSAIYAVILWSRKTSYRLGLKKTTYFPIPIIVVGNIFVGGTGKTPALLAITTLLSKRGWNVGIISRGYGATIGPTAKLVEYKDLAEHVGDEPLLLRRLSHCPVAVHPRRTLAVERLLQAHPEINVILADDGLQHLALGRDMELLVEDSRGVGNGWLLPVGPLRDFAWKKKTVDAILCHQASADCLAKPPLFALQSSVRQARQLVTGTTKNLSDFSQSLRIVAAAGIGHPDKFFQSLKSQGIFLHNTFALPDHAKESFLRFEAIEAEIIFITEKDAVKCSDTQDARIWVVPLETEFLEPTFISWLEKALHERQKNF